MVVLRHSRRYRGGESRGTRLWSGPTDSCGTRASSGAGPGPSNYVLAEGPRRASRSTLSRLVGLLIAQGRRVIVKIESGTDLLLAHVDDEGVGWVTFNNPARHNALSLEMMSGAPRALEALEREPSVGVIVMTGAGESAFVSGADISEFEKNFTSLSDRAKYNAAIERFWDSWSLVSKPTVAMVHGYCIGGGLLLSLEADIRICSEDSQFGVPAARLGVGYGYSTVAKVVDVVGASWAAEILFSARRLSAQEALRVGLVNHCVPAVDLLAHVRGLSRAIAGNAPLTIAACKASIREMRKDRADRDLSAIDTMVERCFQSEDYLEGQRAFLEKRNPAFTGR